MSERSGRPEGMSWVTPYLTVKDVAVAIEFYQAAFGFTKKNAMEGPDGKIMHGEVTWNDASLMLGPECSFSGNAKAPATSGISPPVSLYVYCKDVDALFARATEVGAEAALPPNDQFWGDRMCKLIDPDGHHWHFATHIGHGKATQEQSEPAEVLAN